MDGLVLKAARTEVPLRPVSRLVLIALADLAKENRLVTVTYRGLTVKAGMSLKGVTTGVTELVATGLIRKLNAGSGRRPITYELRL